MRRTEKTMGCLRPQTRFAYCAERRQAKRCRTGAAQFRSDQHAPARVSFGWSGGESGSGTTARLWPFHSPRAHRVLTAANRRTTKNPPAHTRHTGCLRPIIDEYPAEWYALKLLPAADASGTISWARRKFRHAHG